jgi:hypothetical protein
VELRRRAKDEQQQAILEQASKAMDKQEWEILCKRHQEAQAQHHCQAEAETPSAPTAGEQQVRSMYEQNRPTLDPATQALWDAWLDARCRAIVDSALEMVADTLGEITGEIERELRKDMNKGLADVRKDFVAKMSKLRKELTSTRGTNVVDLPNNPLVRKA